MHQAVEVSGLSKEFILTKNFNLFSRSSRKSILAIDNVFLEAKPGEVLSLIGPNGSGKTTLIKILACLIWPTRGVVRVMGYDALKNENRIKALIGLACSDERSFYWRLTLRENLYFFGALFNLSLSRIKKSIDELGAFLDLDESLDKRFQECSSGIKQRLVIARSLINDPKLIFMDEPFKNLDPLNAKKIMGYIKTKLVNEQGKTVLFITHNLKEAEEFSDRIAVMQQGKILKTGTLKELSAGADSCACSLENIYEKLLKPLNNC